MESSSAPIPFWVKWVAVSAALVIGWLFIAWQNRFHITAPLVFVCLGYLAVVMTVVNLWRTGASAVARDQYGAEAWARPIGERDELEREKRTLLKAIKEAEIDRDMGKLSPAEAATMIHNYRARAIEVIKALEGHQRDSASVREKIEREVKARLELAEKGQKGGAKKKGKREEAPQS
jgi:hypothetical protein